jgi:hypothetical protein
MEYLVSFTALLVLQAHAIDFVLFKDTTCNDFEDEGYLCQGYGYNQCCGMLSSSGELYGAAAVALGDTTAGNTPVLRACNEGAGGVATPCDMIRTQVNYTPNTDTAFPCLEGPYGSDFSGFIVQPFVTATKREEQQAPGYPSIAGSNGIGLVENGTIHGLKEESESFKSYVQKKDGMTREERRAVFFMGRL